MVPRRRSSSSPFFPLPLLIILTPIVFFVFLFFVVPPFLSLTSQILRPSAVKKSWDSFIVLLVLFAIFCGFFARKNDESLDSTEERAPVTGSSKENEELVVTQQWPFGLPEKKIYEPLRSTAERGMGRLRSSSSYPDLKHESMIENGDYGFQFRFFDDFDMNRYRLASPEKIIQVDSISIRSLASASPRRKSPTPPPPPPPVIVHKQRRTHQSIRRKEEGESLTGGKREKSATEITKIQTPTLPVTARKHSRTYHTTCRKEEAEPLIGETSGKRAEITKIQTPPPPQPPPLPPSLVRPARLQWQAKEGKVERRKSNAKEIVTVLASLYKQSKRKKKEKTQKSDDYVASPEQPVHRTRPPPSPPPPPPPPLPPPPSMFHSFFKKASRSKKVHSVTASQSLVPAASFPARSPKGKSPIPPPPPPRPSRRKNSTNDGRPPLPKNIRSFPDLKETANPGGQSPLIPIPPPPPRPSRRKNSTNDGRPPLPKNIRSFPDLKETANPGGQSPLIPIPPPPPPFQMTATKFVIRGDFARIQSTNSSRCNSPEREEVEPPLLKEDLQKANKSEDNNKKRNSVFCPSPDVNTKADNFIARLRDEWRLEKMNSMKEKTRSLQARS